MPDAEVNVRTVRSLVQLVTVGGALSAIVSTALAPGIPVSAATTPAQPGDFNGDGFRDLAVGDAGDGAVTILRATSSGLTATGSTTFGAASLGANGTKASFGLALPTE
jgi:hypothetical protein